MDKLPHAIYDFVTKISSWKLCLFIFVIVIVLFISYDYYTKRFTKERYHNNKVKEYNNKISQTETNKSVITYNPIIQTGNDISTDNNTIITDKPITDKPITEKPKDHRELYHLYSEGVLDSYDEYGNLLVGIRPDIPKMFYHYNEVVRSPEVNVQDYLFMARVHHYGMYGIDPDAKQAIHYYQLALRVCDDNMLARNIYTVIGELNHNLNYQFNNNNNNNYYRDIIVIEENVKDPVIIDNVIKFIPDNQNTHDSGVVATTKDAIKNLGINNNDVGNGGSVGIQNTVVNYLQNNYPNNNKTQNSIKVINQLNDKIHGTYGVSEIQTLNTIWSKIKDNPDSIDIFIDELADTVEHDTIVCSTGRIGKLINTLNGVDDAVDIKPSYILSQSRQEIIDKASILSKQNDNPVFIKTELEKEYIDSGIMTKDLFDKLTEDWINNY